jgi:hypothetical protein
VAFISQWRQMGSLPHCPCPCPWGPLDSCPIREQQPIGHSSRFGEANRGAAHLPGSKDVMRSHHSPNLQSHCRQEEPSSSPGFPESLVFLEGRMRREQLHIPENTWGWVSPRPGWGVVLPRVRGPTRWPHEILLSRLQHFNGLRPQGMWGWL